MEILANTRECIARGLDGLDTESTNGGGGGVIAVGITNQRETTVVWDSMTGEPLHRAIVWSDMRTSSVVEQIIRENGGGDKDFLREKCGLPVSTYFSGIKLRWLVDNVPQVRQAIERGTCMFGTVDSWLIWNLTGGVQGGIHVTDVTNASRTMLMDINTLQWDKDLMKHLGIPEGILFPEIRSSAEVYGHISDGPGAGIAIAGCVGDQQSATIGQRCLRPGEAKNTYGTGCFLLVNTGEIPVQSKHGLLTTLCFQLGNDQKPVYALEGSIAVAGSGIEWLKDNLGIIQKASEAEPLAATVDNTEGVYFVPAFSGLFAPRWRTDARGTIVGMTQYTTKAHIVRAMLESVAFQTKEVIDAINKDSPVEVSLLKVDGGMSCNNLLMQIQSDILGGKVLRPQDMETTAKGAAICAAIGAGLWKPEDLYNANDHDGKYTEFDPSNEEDDREWRFARWKAAVDRSVGWLDNGDSGDSIRP